MDRETGPSNTSSDDDLAALYDQSPCGFLSISRDGRIIKVNQTFLDWTGHTREALLSGKRFTDLLSIPGRIFYSTQFGPMLQLQQSVKEVAFDLNCVGRGALPVLVNAATKKDSTGQTCLTRITVFDVTQRRQYERQLLQGSKNAERLAAVIACSGDAVFSTNAHGAIDSWNAGAEALFGKSAAVTVGQPVASVIQPDRPEAMAALFTRVGKTAATEAIELTLTRPDSRELSVVMTVSVIRDALENVIGLSAIARDISDRREAQERLLHASLHDTLTELPNRVLFTDRVARCVEHARQDPSFLFAVLSLDLDRFETINDSLGHVAGDKLLIGVAQKLTDCLNAAAPQTPLHDARLPMVARLGGDEFAILLENLKSPAEALRMAEQISQAINRTHALDAHEMFVSASIGIAFPSAAHQSAEEVMRDADAAMHRAKATGKARYAVFDADMHKSVLAHFTLGNNLRRALERNELSLHYQPLISLATRQLHGFEALARWSRDGKFISPAEFIPISEEMGLIVPIGQWVLEQACAQLVQWQATCPQAAGLTMAINISRKQLADPQLIGVVRRTIAGTGVQPHNLKLEITESVIMERSDGASVDVLSRLKETGALLAMDDFGTGYSSLSCLHKFPINVLKLDKSFIDDMARSSGAATVVSGVISLAQNLGLTVVAEGVETAQQVAFLQSLRCDIGQGYIFSRPLPADKAEAFIRNPPQLASSA